MILIIVGLVFWHPKMSAPGIPTRSEPLTSFVPLLSVDQNPAFPHRWGAPLTPTASEGEEVTLTPSAPYSESFALSVYATLSRNREGLRSLSAALSTSIPTRLLLTGVWLWRRMRWLYTVLFFYRCFLPCRRFLFLSFLEGCFSVNWEASRGPVRRRWQDRFYFTC